MSLVSRLCSDLSREGVLSPSQADSARVALAIGDVPRGPGSLARRYIVSYDDAPRLNVKFIPHGWSFEIADIAQIYARYAKFRSFRVPRLLGHFRTDEGSFFAEEYLPSGRTLAQLIEDGTISPAEAVDVIREILREIWDSGRKPSPSFIRLEKERYRGYLQPFISAGVLAEVTADYLDRIIDTHRASLRRVWSAGDIIDKNIVRSGDAWYLVDFEYTHETLFFFKEAFRTILISEWAWELSLDRLCPFLGDFPERAAPLLALAWERHLYSLVLDKQANQSVQDSLKRRFWQVFGADLADISEPQLARAKQESAAKDDQLRRLEDAIQTQGNLLKSKDEQVRQIESEKERIADEAIRSQRAAEDREAHGRALEAEVSRMLIQQSGLQAHAHNLEAELTRLRESTEAKESRLQEAQARAHNSEAELGQVRLAHESAQAHARGLEAEVSRLQIQQGNLQAHIRNLEAVLSRLREEGERLREAQARVSGLEAEVSRLQIQQGNLQAHIRDLELELVRLREEGERLREAPARASGLEAEVSRLQIQQGNLHAHNRDLELELSRLREEGERLREAQARASGLEAEVHRLSQTEAALRVNVGDTEADVRQLQAAISRVSQQLDEKEGVVDAVLRSRSWRVTRPMRWLTGLLRSTSRHTVKKHAALPPGGFLAEGRPAPSLIHHIEIFSVEPGPAATRKVAVHGWCFAPSSGESTQLELRSGGVVLREIRCDLVREDVAAAHAAHLSISSLPRCGFRADVTVDQALTRFELYSPEFEAILAVAASGESQSGTPNLLDGIDLPDDRLTNDVDHTLVPESAEYPELARDLPDDAGHDVFDTGEHRVSFVDFVRQVRGQARVKVSYRTALSPTKWRQWFRRTIDEYQLYRVQSQLAPLPVLPSGTAAAAMQFDVADPAVDYAALEGRPLKVACFTHNLNLEGATKVLLDMAVGLGASQRISPIVVSPFDGPARQRLEDLGMRCQVVPLQGTENLQAGWRKQTDYQESVDTVCEFLAREKPDVVVAIVLNNFFVIEAASRLSIPSLWLIQESYDRSTMIRSVNPFALPAVERAFGLAYRVIFASKGTSALYERYNRKGHFRVIHNALRPAEIEAASDGSGKEEARRLLRIPTDKKVVVSVGTVCARKDQATLARGLGLLAQQRNDFLAYLVGARYPDPYAQSVAQVIDKYAAADRVKLVPETADVHTYYRAADLFVFASRNESFPLVILEAMAHGLPIVTTSCIGVAEQVRFGVNALAFEFGDENGLATQVAQLLDDHAKRESMGRSSLEILASIQSYDDAMRQYEELLISAHSVALGLGRPNEAANVAEASAVGSAAPRVGAGRHARSLGRIPRLGSALRYHVDRFAIARDPFSGDRFLYVLGWCCARSIRNPMTLAVRHNGREILSLSCDIAREDVVAAIGPSIGENSSLPRCGFAEQIPFEEHSGDLELTCPAAGLTLAHRPVATVEADTPQPAWLEQAPNHAIEGVADTPEAALDESSDSDRGGFLALESLRRQPPRVLFFSHSLGLEGMPKLIVRIAAGLKAEEMVEPLIASPVDGPMRDEVEQAGLRLDTWHIDAAPSVYHGWQSIRDYKRSVASVAAALRREAPDVVVVSTVHSFFVVNAAAEMGIPCIWAIQEHYNAAAMSQHISACAREACERAFAHAHRVVFASQDTYRLYRQYHRNGNFRVIHNGIEASTIDDVVTGLAREEARERLGLPMSDRGAVLLSVGTVGGRKDQLTLLKACQLLAEKRRDFLALVVGPGEGDPYFRMLRRLAKDSIAPDLFRIVPGTTDIGTYYRAADIFVLTSLVESFSVAMLEAMAYGLPVVSTPCGGVGEQVRFGSNALRIPFRDATALAGALAALLDDEARRLEMGRVSREVFESLCTEEQMVKAYGGLILSAYREAKRA